MVPKSVITAAATWRRAALAGAAAALSVAATSAEAEDVTGRWATPGFGSIVRLHYCSEEPTKLCGELDWLWEALDDKGRPRTDSRNPDFKQRERALLGVEILSGFSETSPGVWTGGSLYNPDDGRTYSGSIRFTDGVLRLQGCAVKVFCRTQTWRKPADLAQQSNEG